MWYRNSHTLDHLALMDPRAIARAAARPLQISTVEASIRKQCKKASEISRVARPRSPVQLRSQQGRAGQYLHSPDFFCFRRNIRIPNWLTQDFLKTNFGLGLTHFEGQGAETSVVWHDLQLTNCTTTALHITALHSADGPALPCTALHLRQTCVFPTGCVLAWRGLVVPQTVAVLREEWFRPCEMLMARLARSTLERIMGVLLQHRAHVERSGLQACDPTTPNFHQFFKAVTCPRHCYVLPPLTAPFRRMGPASKRGGRKKGKSRSSPGRRPGRSESKSESKSQSKVKSKSKTKSKSPRRRFRSASRPVA